LFARSWCLDYVACSAATERQETETKQSLNAKSNGDDDNNNNNDDDDDNDDDDERDEKPAPRTE
jgi:hypothetical protein